ncbi:MAG: gluconate 2-dehydrogenase subunit 3 family protein [Gemmatimonadales bacterium]|nr:gluconate 2-dehydrogenase subunit 3 family protein [Gemmatimonadales bacterium]
MHPQISYPSGTVRALLETDLVTRPTRDALSARLEPPDSGGPRFFMGPALTTLRAACARLIPQPHRTEPIDLARCIDERLATGAGNGWRYDSMPADGDACLAGLAGLDQTSQARYGTPFHELDGARQDDVLRAVQRGAAQGEVWTRMPATRFFEELLAECVEFYYSHPLAQEEIGYVGMADAPGWRAIGLNRLEPREPRAEPDTGG